MKSIDLLTYHNKLIKRLYSVEEFKNFKTDDNIIKIIFNEIYDFTNISNNVKEIELYLNSETILNLDFKNCNKIKVLRLHIDSVEEIDENIFKPLENLFVLEIFNNWINKFPQELFTPLKSLIFLTIHSDFCQRYDLTKCPPDLELFHVYYNSRFINQPYTDKRLSYIPKILYLNTNPSYKI